MKSDAAMRAAPGYNLLLQTFNNDTDILGPGPGGLGPGISASAGLARRLGMAGQRTPGRAVAGGWTRANARRRFASPRSRARAPATSAGGRAGLARSLC